ncbi:MAG: response regulator [Gemmatimonadota bacterium]
MTAPRPHLLVAEDNQLVCDAMRVLFDASGYRVSTAGHIAEIIDIATSDPVDLLLLDLGLSGGDGFDVLATLRAEGAMPRVCVALTGRDEPETALRCKEAGCVAMLLKPVPSRDLVRMVGEWLAGAD